MKTFSQHRSYVCSGCLLALVVIAAWLPPAAQADWPYWPFKKEEKPGKPEKIVALWSDTTLTQPGRPPIRGFGARLMFYEEKNDDPVKVEGMLVVYAFDETNREPNNNRPDRKYVITPEQLPAHYSKSKAGHSYSVWIPWDEAGGMQKEFTLIVRFQPKEGKVALSEPIRQLLPGKTPPPSDKSKTGGIPVPAGLPPWTGNAAMAGVTMPGGVQPAAYQTAITDGSGVVQPEWQQRRITTATIDVPSGSTIRAALTTQQMAPGAGNYPPTAEAARQKPGQNYPPQDYPPQNFRQNYQPPQNYQAPQHYPPQNSPPMGYAPQPAPAASQGLQLRAGFGPGRQWPLGEPLARLNRDHGPSQPPPAGSPSGPASGPGASPANAAQAGPQGGSQYSN
jgi:hypothetical protein